MQRAKIIGGRHEILTRGAQPPPEPPLHYTTEWSCVNHPCLQLRHQNVNKTTVNEMKNLSIEAC